jgi:hypothetical protein
MRACAPPSAASFLTKAAARAGLFHMRGRSHKRRDREAELEDDRDHPNTNSNTNGALVIGVASGSSLTSGNGGGGVWAQPSAHAASTMQRTTLRHVMASAHHGIRALFRSCSPDLGDTRLMWRAVWLTNEVARIAAVTLAVRPPHHPQASSGDTTLTIVLVGVGVIVLAGVVLIVVLLGRRRGASGSPGNALTPGPPAFAASGASVVQNWMAACPLLETMGLSKLDAETYTANDGRVTTSLYVSLMPKYGEVHAWLDVPCPGGAVERFFGQEEKLSPREHGRSDLAKWVFGAVGETFAQLPKQARVSLKAPEIPGDDCKMRVESPLISPEIAPAVVRLLRSLSEAASRPAGDGAPQGALPPVYQTWTAAAPMLEQLGLRKLDAECFIHEVGSATRALYVKLEVTSGEVAGFIDKPCPGGAPEQFIGREAVLAPGERGASGLERWAATQIMEVMAGLPRGAKLRMTAPEMPGADLKMSLRSKLAAPEHAAIVARVLMMLTKAASGPGG